MVPLVDRFLERFSQRRSGQQTFCFGSRASGEEPVGKRPDQRLHLPFVEVRHQRQRHASGPESFRIETPELLRFRLPDSSGRTEDATAQGMALEEFFLESVIDIVRRRILGGNDFVDDYAPFRVDGGIRENGFRRQLKQQRGGLAQVLLEDGGMEHDLFLGREGIQFAAEAFEATVDGRRTLVPGPFEEGMFGEMGDAGGESALIARTAPAGQGAPADRSTAAEHRIAESALCLSTFHRTATMRLRSSGRNPAGRREEILWRRK